MENKALPGVARRGSREMARTMAKVRLAMAMMASSRPIRFKIHFIRQAYPNIDRCKALGVV